MFIIIDNSILEFYSNLFVRFWWNKYLNHNIENQKKYKMTDRTHTAYRNDVGVQLTDH